MEYTKSDIAIIMKKKKRTIQYWTDFGLVVPDVSPSQGRGKARVYSDKNLVQFAMVEYLGQLGVELNTIKEVMNGLRKGYDEFEFGEEIVFTDGRGHMEKTYKRRITFSDFFENGEWGEAKELAYIECCYPLKSTLDKRLFRQYHMFSIELESERSEKGFRMGRSEDDLFNKILWLGQIKIRAVKDLLGMDSLLSIGHI